MTNQDILLMVSLAANGLTAVYIFIAWIKRNDTQWLNRQPYDEPDDDRNN